MFNELVKNFRVRLHTEWDGESVWMGDYKLDSSGEFLELPFSTWGNYGGSTVSRSNFNWWIENKKESRGRLWVEINGGYNSHGILIKLSELSNEDKENIEQLFDYPLFDDEYLSNLEYEILEESIPDWILNEVKSSDSDYFDQFNDEQIISAIWQVWGEGSVYFIFEDAVSCWVRSEELTPAVKQILG